MAETKTIGDLWARGVRPLRSRTAPGDELQTFVLHEGVWYLVPGTWKDRTPCDPPGGSREATGELAQKLALMWQINAGVPLELLTERP